jgi:hypothetical protein
MVMLFYHNRSTRSLSALADDFDPLERNLDPHSLRRCSDLTPFSSQSSIQGNGNGTITPSSAFDPFVTASGALSAGAVGPVSANPYSHDAAATLGGATFFTNQTGFQQPVC